MPLEFVPFYKSVFGNPDGSVLVRLITSKLLVYPRVSISGKPQPTFWLPLFDCSDKTFYAILAGIHKVFLVLDDLAHFSDKSIVVSDHSIKAIIGIDTRRPATM